MRLFFWKNIHNELKMDTDEKKAGLKEYPRPRLKRDSFINLNGKWDDGAVVPYPLGSVASGVKGKAAKTYSYFREFEIPQGFIKDKVILNFGAVDQVCSVYVNDVCVGTHEGGYVPFSFDITKALMVKNTEKHIIRVEIEDKLSALYPYGKQRKKRGGMWYTPISGIWQTVWLESVSNDYVRDVEITPSLTGIDLNIESDSLWYEITVLDGKREVLKTESEYGELHLDIKNPHLWSPDDPHLYDLVIRTKNDEVKSYFGLRTIEIAELGGKQRILLNKRAFFFNGVLDQGYFPEGIYTPNSESVYEDDIKRLKNLGFNTIRKHIKVEPQCFYEACDRLGMLVLQDMVNNGEYNFFGHTAMPAIGVTKLDDTKRRVKDEVKNQFAISMEDTVTLLYSHPSVVYYTIFNEGWGQFEADAMYGWLKTLDKTRIVDSTSGWFWQHQSDVDSYHFYFKPITFEASKRPVIVSECGGFSLKIKEHAYSKFSNYGYGKVKNKEELTKRITKLYEEEIIPQISKGLCGVIYTQAYDVEDETNGFYTYDRKVCKVNVTEMKRLSRKLKVF